MVKANTPFLLCLQDINKLRIKYDNLQGALIKVAKDRTETIFLTVMKYGHPFLLLEKQSVYTVEQLLSCYMTESELKRLHRRFGHLLVQRLYDLLTRAGCDDINREALEKLTKVCH